VRSAQEIIGEIGVNMAAFPTAAHLVSWAKFAPIAHQSAGKNKGVSTGKGNPWLAATIGEAVAFLGERYRRLVRRRGKKRAIVAVGNTMLTIIWHLLSDPDALPRPRPRLLRIEDQQTTPATRPCPPTRTPHRPQGHPGTQARPTRRRLRRGTAPAAQPTRLRFAPPRADACPLQHDF
jgi:hypothetical protein